MRLVTNRLENSFKYQNARATSFTVYSKTYISFAYLTKRAILEYVRKFLSARDCGTVGRSSIQRVHTSRMQNGSQPANLAAVVSQNMVFRGWHNGSRISRISSAGRLSISISEIARLFYLLSSRSHSRSDLYAHTCTSDMHSCTDIPTLLFLNRRLYVNVKLKFAKSYQFIYLKK